MADYSFVNYMNTTPDGQHFDIYNTPFRNLRYIVPTSKSIVVDASLAGNAPTIAHIYLGSTSLWWVILHYNGLADGRTDIKAGDTLWIPDKRSLIAVLETQSKISTQITL